MEGCKLKDYGGDYEVFMEENQEEAEIMAEKEEVKKEQAKKQIKAKSKVWETNSDLSGFASITSLE